MPSSKKQRERKNLKLLCDFAEFCIKHPELRFWQALRAWAEVEKIYHEVYDKEVDDNIALDTFYFKDKNK